MGDERQRIRDARVRAATDRAASTAQGLHHTAMISSDLERTAARGGAAGRTARVDQASGAISSRLLRGLSNARLRRLLRGLARYIAWSAFSIT